MHRWPRLSRALDSRRLWWGREVTRQFPAGFVVMRRFRFAFATRTTAFVLARHWCYWLKVLWLECGGKANRGVIWGAEFLVVNFLSLAGAWWMSLKAPAGGQRYEGPVRERRC